MSPRKFNTPSPLKRPRPSPKPKRKEKEEEETYIAYTNPLESSLAQQVLILGMILYTHLGRADEAEERMRHLHALFDGGFALCDDSSSSAAAAVTGQGGDGEGGYVEVGFSCCYCMQLEFELIRYDYRSSSEKVKAHLYSS